MTEVGARAVESNARLRILVLAAGQPPIRPADADLLSGLRDRGHDVRVVEGVRAIFSRPRPDVAYAVASSRAAVLQTFVLKWLRGVPIGGATDLSFLSDPLRPRAINRVDRLDRLERSTIAASWDRPRLEVLTRAADASLSVVGLVLLCVPMAVVALAVLATMGRPIFYTQERPGRYAKSFRMFKVRTMRDSRGGGAVEEPDADRVTRFGAFLRQSSLDEVPELWNVLRGDMALIGPRPLLPRYTDHFTEVERERFLVRPGVTGLAQVQGRNTAAWDSRLRLDVEYVRQRSIRLNVRILFQTFSRVLSARGVVIDPESQMKNLDDERSVR